MFLAFCGAAAIQAAEPDRESALQALDEEFERLHSERRYSEAADLVL